MRRLGTLAHRVPRRRSQAAWSPPPPPRPTRGGCRSRPRSPSRGTATGTAAACRSTAPRARPATGLGCRADRRVLLPRDRRGRAPAARSGSTSAPTPPTTWSCVPRPGLTVTRPRGRRERDPARPTAPPAGGSSGRRRRPPRAVALPCRPLADVAHPRRAAARSPRRRAGHAGHPERRPVLPRPAHGRPALRWPGHGQHGAAWSPTSVASSRSRCRRCGAPAAVRAQSVAARTYAAYERAHPRSSAFESATPPSCQVYGGVRRRAPRLRRRDRAPPAARCSTHGGAPAFTQFSSSSGGWTVRRARCPTCRRKQDPYDGWAGNPVHDWSITVVGDSTFESPGPSLGNLRRITVVRRDGNGDWGGRVALAAARRLARHRHRLRRHDALACSACARPG